MNKKSSTVITFKDSVKSTTFKEIKSYTQMVFRGLKNPKGLKSFDWVKNS